MADADIKKLRELLTGLTRAMRTFERLESGCCGLSLSQCYLLLEVSADPHVGLSVTDAALRLSTDTSTVSRVADGLVRKGYLVRETNGGDRRIVRIRTSPMGELLASRILSGMDQYVASILAQIPQDRLGLVIDNLELLVCSVARTKEECCSGERCREGRSEVDICCGGKEGQGK